MKRTKQEKAITLIALIITIVVLLILAVVAINAVTGDGIIQHAVNAKTSYENAQAKEQGMISYYQTYLETEGQVGKWIQNKTKVTRVNEDGTVDELEVGDTVDYKKDAQTKYRDNIEGSGAEITWKVLGVEDGKVLLVSAENVEMVQLEGAEGYNTGISVLNAKGANYDDGIGAVADSGRSIDVDDINRVTGYNPLKTGDGTIYKEGKVGQYLKQVTYKAENGNVYYKLIDEQEWSVKTNTTFTKIDKTTLGEGKTITVESSYYAYNPITLLLANTEAEVKGISTDSNAYKLLIEGTEIESNRYWLGTSFVGAYEGYIGYGLHTVVGKRVSVSGLFSSQTGDSEAIFGVRAVVSLKSDVQFVKIGENTYNITVIE